MQEAEKGTRTCAYHPQGMGRLKTFNHMTLSTWIHDQLTKKGKDCGMGWIPEDKLEGVPKSDVPSTQSKYSFMRMLLWVGAEERGTAACPHHALHPLPEWKAPTRGEWGNQKIPCIMVPSAFKDFDDTEKNTNYTAEYNVARRYVKVARDHLCNYGEGRHATPTAPCNRA